MRLEDIPNALVPKVDAMLTESFAIRHVVFADEEHPEWEVYRTFRDDYVYDLTQRFDWKGIRPWAECKDVFVDFFEQKYRRYAVAFARHLISKDYRPATLHVRDMDALRFSVARFDGTEKVLMDDLNIFSMEDGRVVTC
jgi:hypothetical protein